MSVEVFNQMLVDVAEQGKLTKPRDQLVREIENYSYILQPYERFQSFKSRKLNLKYIKREFLWYLKGDRFDTSICEHAKIWRDVVNKDGSINSNYGQYVFGSINQFDTVVETLTKDKDSRRASISILSKDHLQSDTNDVPCTYAINFRIRNDYLKMSVLMRSQDAVFGVGNDAPCFSFIHEMMFNTLKKVYPDLEYGSYYHHVDSFHVYERHFDFLEKVCHGDPYEPVECPRISGPEEVTFLRQLAPLDPKDRGEIPEGFKFTKWLMETT